jgi:hypothetical protein
VELDRVAVAAEPVGGFGVETDRRQFGQGVEDLWVA